MDVVTTIVGAIAGGITGFFTSLYFWNKDRTKDAPRIAIEGKSTEEYSTAFFSVRNTGFTHADDIVVTRMRDRSVMERVDELAPDRAYQVLELEEDESEELHIVYRDVWGREYESVWYLSGPEYIEIEDPDSEGGVFTFFEPYTIERLD